MKDKWQEQGQEQEKVTVTTVTRTHSWSLTHLLLFAARVAGKDPISVQFSISAGTVPAVVIDLRRKLREGFEDYNKVTFGPNEQDCWIDVEDWKAPFLNVVKLLHQAEDAVTKGSMSLGQGEVGGRNISGGKS